VVLYRFLSVPNASTDVQGIQTKAGFVPKGGVVELTTEEQERIVGPYGLEPVSEEELTPEELARVVRFPVQQEEESAPQAPPQSQAAEPAPGPQLRPGNGSPAAATTGGAD